MNESRTAWLVLAVGLVVLLGVGSNLEQGWIDRFIFQPSPGVDMDPSVLGVPVDEVNLTTEDGVQLHAFYLPSDGRRAMLFLHGNAGNASHRLPNALELQRLGTDVLLLDYRGYGRSEGTPTESGVYSDARAALRYLAEERALPEERIVLFGRSLGGAVAVELAQDRSLAGVILESTFDSVGEMLGHVLGPLAPLMRPFVRGRFDSVGRIARVRAPLLFFHGDHDGIVPIEYGRRLFDAAPEPKTFQVIAGAGHNDTTLVGGRAYFEQIRRFLDQVAPRQGNG